MEHKITWMSHRRLKCACGAAIVIQDDDLRGLTKTQAHDKLLDSHDIHVRSMKEQGR